MIKRQLLGELKKRLFSGKVILLTGPRQVGKTTLLQEMLWDQSKVESLVLDGDDPTTRDLLNQPNTEQIREILGSAKLIVMDEAQRINGIGLTAKIIVDQMKERQLILSGSSSFDLTGVLQEPLTGRKWTYHLYPISWSEFQQEVGYVQAEQALQSRMVYGMYPDVLSHRDDQELILKELVDSYLFKDVLAYAGLRKPDIIYQLVRALAFQVGQEVNLNELANLLKVDAKTVSHYIEVLEQAFVVFRLPSFSRNLRNEIKRNRKIYFHDNGVRNMVIGQIQPISMRDDIGALWENFLISERWKQIQYEKRIVERYFWRTKQQQEVDYLEEEKGEIRGFEFKWNPKKRIRFPKTFVNTYSAETKGIHRGNFREFVMPGLELS